MSGWTARAWVRTVTADAEAEATRPAAVEALMEALARALEVLPDAPETAEIQVRVLRAPGPDGTVDPKWKIHAMEEDRT